MDMFRFSRNLNLGVKLNVVVVLALSILLAIIVTIMTRSVETLIAQTGRHRVEQEAGLIQSRFTEAEQSLFADAKLLVSTSGLVEALAGRDATMIKTALSIGAVQFDLDDVDVVDADGARLAAMVEVDEISTVEQEDALLSSALLGIEIAGVIFEEGALKSRLVVALPVHDVAGELVGGLLASRVVDDEFLEAINLSRTDEVQIVLIRSGWILAHEFVDLKELEEFSAVLLDEATIERALSGQTVIADNLLLSAEGMPYALAHTPLIVGGDTHAAIGILINYHDLFVFQRQLTTDTATIFVLLALAAVAAVALFAWKGISAPMHRLTDLAQVVTQGNLDVEAQVKSGDEIGVLANAFNHMVVRLREMLRSEQEQRERLAERTRELSASEKRFRDIVESTSDWIWEVNAAGRYTYCSESVTNVLGYTPEQVLGKTPFEFMLPDEAARVGEVFAQIAADRQPIVDLEKRDLAQDGREVVVLTNGVPILDGEGNLLGYRGVDKDITERVQAESRLQERRMYLEAVLRAAPDAIVTMDAQHRIVEWNPGAESLFGYSQQEVTGQNVDDLIVNPDTFEEAVGLSRITAGGDDVPPTEVVRYHKNGSPVDAIVAVSPILAGGELLGAVAVYTDISERKRAEEEIKQRGAELEALQEISLAINAQLELDELLRNVVERGCRLLNVEAGGVYLVDETRSDLAFVVSYGFAKDRTGVRLGPGEGIAGKVLQSGELLVVDDYRHWEGRSLDWETESLTAVLGVPLKRGDQVAGVLNFAETTQARSFDEHDVWLATLFANQAAIAIENARLYEEVQQELAEREQAEKETRRLKEFNESIVQNMSEGIVVQDAEGCFSFVNPAAATMLGYAPDELLGQHWTIIVPPSQQPIVQAADERRAHGETDQYELELVRRDGTRFSVLISGNPRFEGGSSVGTLSVFTDVTERKRAEEQLQHYATELEQTNEEVKQFAYIVSHDLRAPLVNLKGFATELRAALAVIGSALITTLPHLDEKKQQTLTMAIQEDVPEALGFIDSSVTRMDRFINAVLKLSRLGRRELKLEPVDMNALVQATLQTLAHQIEERKASMTVDSLPEVVADRTSMEQILGNLLNNALIYLDPDRPGEIKIAAERDRDKIKFHVRDNGRGIAERDMDKVFAPFRRAGRQDVQGEGMGLPYVQTLVRLHGGRIWVESELGKGSTFYFTIPTDVKRKT